MRQGVLIVALTLAGCGSDRPVMLDGEVADVGVDLGCPAGLTNCGGKCVDTANDPGNCGSCNSVCCSGVMCMGGRCSPEGTVPMISCGTGDCFEPLCECPSIVDPNGDPANCGACGNKCPDYQVCNNGSCTCGEELIDCNGRCMAATSDNNNCGTCGNVCDTANGFTCQAGMCSCVGGMTDCSGKCVNLDTDEDNCGTCGTQCSMFCKCIAGACPATCCGTWCNSYTSCVDTLNDPNNCGSCNNKCPTGQTCVSGQCV